MTHRKGSEFLRSHVLGLVAIFIALTATAVNAGAADDTATSSAVSNAKFKKLKQRVAALETTLNGQAGGDLSGRYPNLQIRANAVNTAEIADNAVARAKIQNDAVNNDKLANDAVTTGKIAANAVDSARLADNSVGSSELKQITTRSGTSTAVNAGTASTSLAANCVAGEEPVSVGGFWSDLSGTGLALSISSTLDGFGGPHTRLVNVANASATNRNFTPLAWCLAP